MRYAGGSGGGSVGQVSKHERAAYAIAFQPRSLAAIASRRLPSARGGRSRRRPRSTTLPPTATDAVKRRSSTLRAHARASEQAIRHTGGRF